MEMMTDIIIREIQVELERQIACAHDGNTHQFNRNNSMNDWVAFISAYAGRAADRCDRNDREGHSFEENMIKVAALAIKAVECSRKGYAKHWKQSHE